MFPGKANSGRRGPRAGPRAGVGGALAAAALAAACRGDTSYPQSTFYPVSAMGDVQNAVFYNTFWWTMAVLVVVCVLILYAVLRFREQPDTPHPEQIHGSTKLEITWTLIPAIIVVFIAVPTVRAIFATQRMAPEEALTIEVIAHQWWWEFRYPEYDLTTANEFYIPVGRPIELRMHSADVVHSFWIPRIGGKRDVNPLPRTPDGASHHNLNVLTFTVREPGLYWGQCAEFCGIAHAIMLMNAVAVPAPEFEDWVLAMHRGPAPLELPAPTVGIAPVDPVDPADTVPAPPAQVQPPRPVRPALPAPTGIGQRVEPPLTADELAARGEEIFVRSACVACHTVTATGTRAMLGPNLARYGARPTVGAGAARNTQENLERWIMSPHALKPGALMPGTRTGGGGMPATNLTDDEVRAVAAYLLSLR